MAGNKLPSEAMMKGFMKKNSAVKEGAMECKRNLKRHIKELQSCQNIMFKISETKIELNPVEIEKSSSEEIWNTIESNFAKSLPFVEQTIEKWNSHTKLIGNLAQ